MGVQDEAAIWWPMTFKGGLVPQEKRAAVCLAENPRIKVGNPSRSSSQKHLQTLKQGFASASCCGLRAQSAVTESSTVPGLVEGGIPAPVFFLEADSANGSGFVGWSLHPALIVYASQLKRFL